jgi:hypothetical protein
MNGKGVLQTFEFEISKQKQFPNSNCEGGKVIN